ncbi:MAG: translation elongation factor Ts [Deltaproteobacteria bacterium GWC2_55_46]|nr:MAG: translation elongation factor Ts [Deltaproteobacteria bacterium GWA2_55_82]OGQ63286.1 MAG: translation elongation factor Ts [Deltaproteobacteria bacterium RIFCSPLOWO2_02_FULL_55_12]OIJ73121.1 MAG: translation elongation factor Ts [Deltaproteobacteria bacterium GWC2_55_46]
MEISAAAVKELREKSGAGIMDCKKALAETKGDIEKAVSFLREKGLAAAQKKASRLASEGIVGSYIHGGKVGVLLEVNCETDFVAKTEGFSAIVREIAMHIAAMNPQYVTRQEVPADVVESEKRIYEAQAKESGKPDHVIAKMVEGKLEKFYKEACLLEQPFVKDPDKTIEKLVIENIAKLGENISIRRFTRFKVGEGLEKKVTDFAAEVAAAQK